MPLMSRLFPSRLGFDQCGLDTSTVHFSLGGEEINMAVAKQGPKVRNQLFTISIKQKLADEPCRLPYCSGSILLLISSIIHLTTKSSRILDKHAVRAMGLSSSLTTY